jgi:hypothetical protein
MAFNCFVKKKGLHQYNFNSQTSAMLELADLFFPLSLESEVTTTFVEKKKKRQQQTASDLK